MSVEGFEVPNTPHHKVYSKMINGKIIDRGKGSRNKKNASTKGQVIKKERGGEEVKAGPLRKKVPMAREGGGVRP